MNRAASRRSAVSVDVTNTGSRDADEVVQLRGGKSLLPSGVRAVGGDFQVGDAVAIADEAGVEFARGLTAYDADAVRRIAGVKTSEVESILGFKDTDEVIHRDDLVLL